MTRAQPTGQRPEGEGNDSSASSLEAGTVCSSQPERASNELAAAQHRIQELERRNRELAALNTVIRSVDYQVNLQRFLNDALSEVVSALGLRAGAIYLRSGQEMLLGALTGLPVELQQEMVRLSTNQTQELLDLRTISGLPDGSTLTFPSTARASGIRSWLAIELRMRQQQAGLLLLGADETERFGEREVEFASSIADQLSITVENAVLFQETRASLHRLEAMHRASQAVNSSLDLERVLEAIATAARDLANADAAGVFEWSEDDGVWQFSIGNALRPEFLEAVNQVAGDTISTESATGQAIETRKPVEIADVLATEENRLAQVYLDEGYRAYLAIPMMQGNRVIGGIGLWWGQSHRTPMDILALLTTLANQSVSAIENARLSTFNERIIRNMDEGLLIENVEGQISFVNPRLCEMLGYDSPKDLIGQRIFSWIDTSDQFVARQQHNAVMAGNRRRYEAKFQAKNGSIIPVLASSAPLVERGGQPDNILTVVTDLREMKQLQERLHQSEKLSALGELVAGVAHELNNPLTSIIGYTQLIRVANVSATIEDDLAKVLSQAERAAEIVRNLLAFARQERPYRQMVDLNDLILRTLALRSYELRVQNIKVNTDLSPDLPNTLADPYQCQQIFLNLILNAEQAMTEAGVGTNISVRTWQENDTIHAEIADDGPGIQHDLLGRVFDPFFTTKEPGKGTGLGLSICYGIVQEHGGRIWAESDGVPGGGSRFRISLPIVTDLEHPDLIELRDRHSARKRPVATSEERILLIDDEDDIIEMIGRVLSEDGYQVVTANNGVEALQRLREASYDLLVCDIKMPEMSGIDLWDQLVERDPKMCARIVFVTGDIANQTTADFLQRTSVPVLRKPFEIHVLSDFVRKVLDEQIHPSSLEQP